MTKTRTEGRTISAIEASKDKTRRPYASPALSRRGKLSRIASGDTITPTSGTKRI